MFSNYDRVLSSARTLFHPSHKVIQSQQTHIALSYATSQCPYFWQHFGSGTISHLICSRRMRCRSQGIIKCLSSIRMLFRSFSVSIKLLSAKPSHMLLCIIPSHLSRLLHLDGARGLAGDCVHVSDLIPLLQRNETYCRRQHGKRR